MNYEWETCDCSRDFERFGEIEPCGCGERHCRLYRDRVIHWLDKHWRLECAFDHAINLLRAWETIKRELEKELKCSRISDEDLEKLFKVED